MVSRRKGFAYAMVMVALTALLGMLALSADLGALCIAKQQLQNAADAAALAAAAQLRHGQDDGAIVSEAVAVARSNPVLGQPLTLNSADVVIGYYDDQGTWIEGWPHTGLPLVRVTARRTSESADGPIEMSFARMFGVETVDLELSATAGVTGGLIGRDPVEIVIAQDSSGSFTDELEQAKAADNDLVGIVEDASITGDTFGVNCFRGDVDRRLNLTSVEDDVETVHSAIDGIYWGFDLPTGTHTARGIEDATDMLVNQGAEGTEHVIVLVSDGMPFGYAEYKWQYDPELGWRRVIIRTEDEVTADRRQAAIDAADAAAAHGIVIHTVTFVQEPPANYNYGVAGADADFNASLVRNGGFAFHTPDTEDLRTILQTVGYIEVGHAMLVE